MKAVDVFTEPISTFDIQLCLCQISRFNTLTGQILLVSEK
jgi:hypothetical protein